MGDYNPSMISGATSPVSTQKSATKKNDQMGQIEFMQLLIAQLKNQDPEAPVDSKEFAVQLAQFTQVEKLTAIDEKLNRQTSSISSVAGYLGQQVMLSDKNVSVSQGQGGQLQINLPQASSEVRVDLLDKAGKVVGQKTFSGLEAGKQIVTLDGLSVPDGTYGYGIAAVRGSGVGYYSPESAVSGLVTGFIPGPDPKLVLGNREVSVGAVREVTLPPKL